MSRFREAEVEFGREIASRLKLTTDGTTILWPQPSDDPEDPQNVSVLMNVTATILQSCTSGTVGGKRCSFLLSVWRLLCRTLTAVNLNTIWGMILSDYLLRRNRSEHFT